MLRAVLLMLALCTPLGAQVLGVGYQIARSDQIDTRAAGGPGLRIRFEGPIDFRYDYLAADAERFDTPCGGFIPPDCGEETIHSSSRLHSFFIGARIRLLSRGPVDLTLLPEAGMVTGSIEKRGVASGKGSAATGGGLGAGVALELSATRVGGTALGGWVAARVRGFAHPGEAAADGYEPHRSLNGIRSLEIGLTIALVPRRGA